MCLIRIQQRWRKVKKQFLSGCLQSNYLIFQVICDFLPKLVDLSISSLYIEDPSRGLPFHFHLPQHEVNQLVAHPTADLKVENAVLGILTVLQQITFYIFLAVYSNTRIFTQIFLNHIGYSCMYIPSTALQMILNLKLKILLFSVDIRNERVEEPTSECELS